MCGILGISVSARSEFSSGGQIFEAMASLYRASESRGKEASGIALRNAANFVCGRSFVPATQLVRQASFRNMVIEALSPPPADAREGWSGMTVIGHTRLVTNGSELDERNNQPVARNRMAVIHNGIITNVDELWARYGLHRNAVVDSEIIPAYLGSRLTRGQSLGQALSVLYNDIEGTFSIAAISSDYDGLLLATNCGSLYKLHDEAAGVYYFASEFLILEKFLAERSMSHFSDAITQIASGRWCFVGLDGLSVSEGAIGEEIQALPPSVDAGEPRSMELKYGGGIEGTPPLGPVSVLAKDRFSRLYDLVVERVARLYRCTRCILPETMPFIEFDAEGVCNYCQHYHKQNLLGLDSLRQRLQQSMKRAVRQQADCIMTFSGGRDSCYGLHFITQELGIKPIAYTYDWGMITDLGRRNQARMCGKLGVEHVLISADIRRKRSNIRKNVLAWLRRPDLGTVPLFMAGDKQYFYYANRLKQQTGSDSIILCENMLETTKFKSGFCGVRPGFDKESHTYSLGIMSKLRMIGHYASAFALNPGYLNSSLWDTFDAFISYYFIPHDYVNLFNYIPWSEDTINRVLQEEYNWELSPDSPSTWRIGDGTASFYNYIYYVLAGLTEFDTFRSNQIREGMLDRAEAMRLTKAENAPRYDSMKWYCDIIGIDFESALQAIHSASPLAALRDRVLPIAS